ncbi:right-handed parallel beta-helix repeat-containing protein, partial [Mucilaginibacter sp.]|uniref:right-handed parallel beta-helix repeat-containing protein n=1 Tax=Mucilaginibacter sp. TaxID=1882438 RepID=UPI0026254BF6
MNTANWKLCGNGYGKWPRFAAVKTDIIPNVLPLVIATLITFFSFFYVGYDNDPGGKGMSTYSSFYIRKKSTKNDPTYRISRPIVLSNKHNITISGLAIAGGGAPAITLKNCSNIRITGNKLYNSTTVGIHLYQCKDIAVDHNFITNVSTGVYVQQNSGGGIVITDNRFLNMLGPLPRGQFVQFNNVNGPRCLIANNVCENEAGKSYAEDAISLYMSNGTAASPMTVRNNRIRGGGPSKTGGGIALGDAGGSYQLVKNNVLVNPGQYGIGVAGGTNMQVLNNKIYARKNTFTNVGISVWNQYKSSCAIILVRGNEVNWTNSNGASNPAWNGGNCGVVEGWDNNIWNSKISSDILP